MTLDEAYTELNSRLIVHAYARERYFRFNGKLEKEINDLTKVIREMEQRKVYPPLELEKPVLAFAEIEYAN